jgi:hypothetical protein
MLTGRITRRIVIPIITSRPFIAFSLSRLEGFVGNVAGEISVRLESTSKRLRRKFVSDPIFDGRFVSE